MWTLYLLRCRDGSLYTGITTDLKRRLKEHNAGAGGAYTRAKRPVRIFYHEKYPDQSAASRREAEVKTFSKFKKEKLSIK